MSTPDDEDFYRVLEVSPDASSEVVRAAYRALVKRYHPDRPPGDAERMRQVVRAWEVLGTPATRAEYDARRRAAEAADAAEAAEANLGRPGWGEPIVDPPPAPPGTGDRRPPPSWRPAPPPPPQEYAWSPRPQNTYQPPPPPSRSNPTAAFALVAGVLAMFPPMSVLGPMAVILGCRAMLAARQHELSGRPMALAGIVLGGIATLLVTG